MWVKRLTVVFVAATVVLCGGVEGNYITVGRTQHGCSPNVNYTNWLTHEQSFYVGDWLMFRFDKYMFIRNITPGGRDVFELNETRRYYFICSKGYCFGGMKVAITVEEPLAPAPSPDHNGGEHRDFMSLMLGFLVSLLWLCAI